MVHYLYQVITQSDLGGNQLSTQPFWHESYKYIYIYNIYIYIYIYIYVCVCMYVCIQDTEDLDKTYYLWYI